MILKTAILVVAAAARARVTLAETKQANRHLSYSTNICTSIIAIAGTPDQSGNNTEDVYDRGEEFECELSTGLTVSIKGQDSQIVQLQDMLNNGTFISGQMTVGVADDLLTVNVDGDESVFSHLGISSWHPVAVLIRERAGYEH